jgi:hypothetical protein
MAVLFIVLFWGAVIGWLAHIFMEGGFDAK